MTQFEYLAVLLSIVLSFGIIRLLDGLPLATRGDRRYPLHLAWLVLVLWAHVQYWWASWSYSGEIIWTYPGFLLVLAGPAVLYSLAITIVPRDASAVDSWRDHFDSVRPRFFGLFALWMVVVSSGSWLVMGQPLWTRLRIGQGAAFALLLGAALTRRAWYHTLLAIAFALVALAFITGTFFRMDALSP